MAIIISGKLSKRLEDLLLIFPKSLVHRFDSVSESAKCTNQFLSSLMMSSDLDQLYELLTTLGKKINHQTTFVVGVIDNEIPDFEQKQLQALKIAFLATPKVSDELLKAKVRSFFKKVLDNSDDLNFSESILEIVKTAKKPAFSKVFMKSPTEPYKEEDDWHIHLKGPSQRFVHFTKIADGKYEMHGRNGPMPAAIRCVAEVDEEPLFVNQEWVFIGKQPKVYYLNPDGSEEVIAISENEDMKIDAPDFSKNLMDAIQQLSVNPEENSEEAVDLEDDFFSSDLLKQLETAPILTGQVQNELIESDFDLSETNSLEVDDMDLAMLATRAVPTDFKTIFGISKVQDLLDRVPGIQVADSVYVTISKVFPEITAIEFETQNTVPSFSKKLSENKELMRVHFKTFFNGKPQGVLKLGLSEQKLELEYYKYILKTLNPLVLEVQH